MSFKAQDATQRQCSYSVMTHDVKCANLAALPPCYFRLYNPYFPTNKAHFSMHQKYDKFVWQHQTRMHCKFIHALQSTFILIRIKLILNFSEHNVSLSNSMPSERFSKTSLEVHVSLTQEVGMILINLQRVMTVAYFIPIFEGKGALYTRVRKMRCSEKLISLPQLSSRKRERKKY